MVQLLTKSITFKEFVEWKPEDESYELHDGVIVQMSQPLGDHEEIKGFLTTEIVLEYKRLNLPYFIPNQALVKPSHSESAYLPDLLLLNRANLGTETLWKKESTVTQGDSIPLVMEIVSTNWRVDYYRKYSDYEEMGIREYWIIDYLATGAYKFLGNPKQPTILVCSLVDGEYQVRQFRDDEQIISPSFPELNLTAQQIFTAGMS